ncbi:MAG: hypothetical protein CVU84_06845 [Firmicutes bacterium HGW-Firmicutes-1]|nr:MAG: hypothetical protein CVU84_06845 [Firmicutes bacterium HGW-Firmicutes-1]
MMNRFMIEQYQTYRRPTFFNKLFSYDYEPEEIKEELINMLSSVIDNTDNVKKKKYERIALISMRDVLNSVKLKENRKEKYLWEYDNIFEGFDLFLDDLNINAYDVKIFIDNDEQTYATAKKEISIRYSILIQKSQWELEYRTF